VKAEILTIGDELLRGEIVDSNKSFLSDRLLSVDAEVRWHTSVGDDPADMREAFRRAAERADVMLVSGGLGPTRDDLTIEVLAETFGRKLVLDEPTLESLRAFFARLGREMAPNNAKQAWFPEGAEILPNPIGTAPGCMLRAEGAVFFCMPGVPRELAKMMDEQVLPRIDGLRGDGLVVRAALLRTFGLGESNLDEELRDVTGEEGVSLGFRTSFPDNYVRPLARAATAAEAEAKLARACDAIHAKLGPLVYGEGEANTMEAVVGRLLRESGQTIAVAESCTGGLLGERITSVPGSSDYFRGGVIAYADDVKTRALGVPEALLAEHGAVSEPVALAMARGVRERLGADFGVSTTGIAGPTGGTPGKPVGLVVVGVAHGEKSQAREFLFPFERERHRAVTAQVALDWVRRTLIGAEATAPRYVRRRP
jgi:nicotinamide-nucleotide amidase